MISYSAETVRRIILGKTQARKCPICEGTTVVNWDENGENIKSGPGTWPDRATGECEDCNGLGFILMDVE